MLKAGESFILWTDVVWSSDYDTGDSGWELCVEPLPSCFDGLPLAPVPVADCPRDGEASLADCRSAQPGELCLGGAACNTRDDINNCYDSLRTHPPTLDVYRKAYGTARTSTTATSTTMTSTTKTTTFGQIDRDGGIWRVAGDCSVDGLCISSPNWPSGYGYHQHCNISLPKPSVLRVVDFATEAGFDFLTINGTKYSGVPGVDSTRNMLQAGDSFVLWTDVLWSSDGITNKRGWELCVEPLPSCFDGLPLAPVPVVDCPRDGEASLADCRSAQPGELCLGGVSCNTRDDINNCYDSLHTYPPKLDVYRKANGTTRTSTSATMTTRTSTTVTSTTKTTTFGQIDRDGGIWRVAGDCSVDGLCISSPNWPSGYGYHQHCNISLPKPSVLRVVDFATEAGFDFLTINGTKYSGVPGVDSTRNMLQAGDSFVLWTDVLWSSDGVTNKRGWELCVEPLPSCFDGLPLAPVPVVDCPRDGEASLADCRSAQPGELCLGGVSCNTRDDINNCYDSLHTYPPKLDVYRKANGTTRTSTSATMTTRTSTTVTSTTKTTTFGQIDRDGGIWRVAGDCSVDGLCISSPNWPSGYGYHQHCNISLPKPSVLRVVDFATEAGFDFLTINGTKYSGVPGVDSTRNMLQAGDSFVLWTDVLWSSDGVTNKRGWELCVEPLPSCFDGLPLAPVPVVDCPRDGEASLADCRSAQPGELCLGGVACNTRDDINNCYDSLYTHPPTLDVYRKANGTTRTTTLTTLTTRTSTTRTTMTRTAPSFLEASGLRV